MTGKLDPSSHAHQNHKRDSVRLQGLNSRREYLSIVPTHHQETGCVIPMRQRNAGASGRRNGAAHARDDLVGDSRSLECLRFLATASEHKRITALQSNDTTTSSRLTDENALISCCESA